MRFLSGHNGLQQRQKDVNNRGEFKVHLFKTNIWIHTRRFNKDKYVLIA